MAYGFVNNFYPFILGERKMKRRKNTAAAAAEKSKKKKKRNLNRFLIHSFDASRHRYLFVHTFFRVGALLFCFPYFVVAFLLFFLLLAHIRASFLVTNFLLHMQLTSDFAVKMKNNSRFGERMGEYRKVLRIRIVPTVLAKQREKKSFAWSCSCLHNFVCNKTFFSSRNKASHHYHHQRNNKMKHDKNKKAVYISLYVCRHSRD